MSTIEDKARAAKQHLDKVAANPASPVAEAPAARRRVPLTLPQQKLWVPEIPGFHLHWFNGRPERIQAAQAAGYEFVDQSEVEGQLTDKSLGGDGLKGGNSDLGSRVSTLANPFGGGDEVGGQPARLYLMKQKQEWYEEDQKLLQARNDSVVDALTASFRTGVVGGKADGETSEDLANRYVGQQGGRIPVKIPDLLRRKTKR